MTDKKCTHPNLYQERIFGQRGEYICPDCNAYFEVHPKPPQASDVDLKSPTSENHKQLDNQKSPNH
jgi:uncharacterized Zn finger protein (UPF0148 family)